MIAKHVLVTGKVQGVFYRAWTREQAEKLALTGWVRNCSDGSVEAQLEGDENALGEMVERMKNGPPAARVEGVQVHEAEAEGLDRFEVRH